MITSYQKGARAENKTLDFLEERGFVCLRVAGSKRVDLIALGSDKHYLIEVKYGGTPFSNFGPEDRGKLKELAAKAYCTPLLVHWKRNARKPDLYGAELWPA